MKSTAQKPRRCRECEQREPAAQFYGRSTLCKECTKDRQHNAYWKAKDGAAA